MSATQAILLLVGLVPLVWVSLSLMTARKVDLTALIILRAPWNQLAFKLRRLVRFKGRVVSFRNEDKTELFNYLEGEERSESEAREKELREQYKLEDLYQRSSRHHYRDNLYVLDVLDRAKELVRPCFAEFEGSELRSIDVGSMDFRYAYALRSWLSARAGKKPIRLSGVELDGDVIYRDLSLRRDHGEAHAREAAAIASSQERKDSVSYQVSDFLRREDDEQDVIFFWFPFVLRYALLRWGLPLPHFLPERMLRHAYSLLKPGGLLLIVNHTEEERHEQLALLGRVGGFAILGEKPASSRLVDYAESTDERRLIVAMRARPEAARRPMLLPPSTELALRESPRLKPLRATRTRIDGRRVSLRQRSADS